MTNFSNSIAALAVYDAGAAERDRVWDEVERNEDADAAEANDKAAAELVQRAFYEDTKGINSLEDCLRVAVKDIRRMATGGKRS